MNTKIECTLDSNEMIAEYLNEVLEEGDDSEIVRLSTSPHPKPLPASKKSNV